MTHHEIDRGAASSQFDRLADLEGKFQIRSDCRARLRSVFLRTVETEGGCWEWQGAMNGNGYGALKVGSPIRTGHAHRFVAFAVGMPVAGLCVCHHCDNRRCINPSHLFVGTQAENVWDCMRKGRFVPPPVSDWPETMKTKPHHWQRLTRDSIPEIRRRLAAGETQKSIASDFGVSFQAISKVKTGERWGHVQ